MSARSFEDATRQDKIDLLGPEFAAIHVIDADFSGSVIVVRVILEGQVVSLVGDPQQALATYLAGQSANEGPPS